MRNEQLIAVLQQINQLTTAALRDAGESAKAVKPLRAKPVARALSESLPDHILSLRNDGFFKQTKTYHDVHSKLDPKYPCEPARVRVALIRLQKRKELRKTSKLVGKTRQVAYVA